MPAVAPSPQEWRIQQAIAMQRADKQVLAQLKASQTALNAQLKALAARPGFSNSIREAQLRLAKREIQQEMAKLFRKLGDITSAMRLEAAARVLKVNEQLDAFKLLGAGLADGADIARAIADAELDAARSGLDRMMARVQGSSYNSLSQRVYTSASGLNGPISTLVNNALAAGLSAREFASAAKDFINPLTPGGVRYASYRLARTEINNAAHALAVDSVQDKPWVSGMRWHLSGSHPRVDICNSIAGGGPKRDGVYPKGSVPAKPHPLCFCYVTPETPDDEEFLNSLIAGHYDGYLEKYRNIQPGQIISSRSLTGATPPAQKAPPQVRTLKSVPATPKTSATPFRPAESFESRLAKAAKEEGALDAAPAWMTIRKGKPYLLSDKEVRALGQYGGIRYNEINRVLRGQGKALALEPGDQSVRSIVRSMDGAIARSALTEDVVVWRAGRITESFFGARADGNLTGYAWRENAFTSTSALREQAQIFGGREGGIIMRILVPKGTHGVQLSSMSAEAELLLERKLRFRVVRDNGFNERGARLIDVEVY